MVDKLAQYVRADAPLPQTNQLVPLYGAGVENLGDEQGMPIEMPMPEYGPDELLVRHDTNSICFSDIKVIRQGEDHARIRRDMKKDPVVLGHEVAMTVVGVGENLKDQYKVGDRFIIQADIWEDGQSLAYGYMIQGGLSQYNVIDQRILNGDHGNYLISLQDSTGYAESALVEPWACVIAAYRLEYRTSLKPGGTTWIIGTPDAKQDYSISAGFDLASHPDRLWLTDVPAAFAESLKSQSEKLGVELVEVSDVANPPEDQVDDIVLLAPGPDLIEALSPKLADFGILAILADEPMPRKVSVDVGRVHYNRWVYVATTSGDVAKAYNQVPVRSTLKPGGRTLFMGAGGPMGRMHVQRAIQVAGSPGTIVCTDVSDLRLDDLCVSYAAEAKAKGIDFVCLNPTDKDNYQAAMAEYQKEGFDDIIILAPIVPVIQEGAGYLAAKGVMNIFAGVLRGTTAELDVSQYYLKDTRVIGHSASSIDDMRVMLEQVESGGLSTNRTVAAIGSLEASRDGIQSVLDTVYPGKVLIFPQIKNLPLTALSDLKDSLPTVYAALKDGREWTLEAEAELLRVMLP